MLNILKYQDPNFDQIINRIINSRKSVNDDIKDQVNEIILNVKEKGDSILFEYMKEYDKVECNEKSICYSEKDIVEAINKCSKESLKALKVAIDRVERFHLQQIPAESIYEDDQKVKVKTRWIPL